MGHPSTLHSPDYAAGYRAGMFSLFQHHLTVDNHHLYTPGLLDQPRLMRREVIDTGLILAPHAKFYPISIDRFIREILDQEFRD